MVDITESELEELVGEDACSVCKAEKRVVREDRPDTHGASVQRRLPAHAAQRCMAVNNVDLFPYDNIPKDGKEGEDGRESGRAIDDPKRHVVDLETIGEIPNALAVVVGVGYDHNLVASVDEPLGQLVYVTFDSTWLGKEEVADHGDVIRGFRHLAC